MGFKSLLNCKKRDEGPANVASIRAVDANVRDAVARPEPRREIPSSTERRYGRCASLKIRFATARTINERREPVSPDRLTTCGVFNKGPISAGIMRARYDLDFFVAPGFAAQPLLRAIHRASLRSRRQRVLPLFRAQFLPAPCWRSRSQVETGSSTALTSSLVTMSASDPGPLPPP
jgi:hypothetical protein